MGSITYDCKIDISVKLSGDIPVSMILELFAQVIPAFQV